MIFTSQELLYIYSYTYDLNKNQLAKDLGVSRQTIYDWYTGKRQVPLIYKKYIALDLSLSPDCLDFDFQPSVPVCPLTKQRLLDLPF